MIILLTRCLLRKGRLVAKETLFSNLFGHGIKASQLVMQWARVSRCLCGEDLILPPTALSSRLCTGPLLRNFCTSIVQMLGGILNIHFGTP